MPATTGRFFRPAVIVTAFIGIGCVVSACGFHLRGLQSANRTPVWETIKVDCPDTENFFCTQLRDQLIQSGIVVLDMTATTSPPFTSSDEEPSQRHSLERDQDPAIIGDAVVGDGAVSGDTEVEDAPVPVLNIIALGGGRRAVTLTSNAGAAEFEVSRAVNFEMTQGNQIILEETTFRQFQTYRYDSQSVLGKDKEEIQIRDDLDNLLAFQVVNRIAIEGIKIKERDSSINAD